MPSQILSPTRTKQNHDPKEPSNRHHKTKVRPGATIPAQSATFLPPHCGKVPFNCALYDSWRVIFATCVRGFARNYFYPAASGPSSHLLTDHSRSRKHFSQEPQLQCWQRQPVSASVLLQPPSFPCRQCLSTIQNHLSALSAISTSPSTSDKKKRPRLKAPLVGLPSSSSPRNFFFHLNPDFLFMDYFHAFGAFAFLPFCGPHFPMLGKNSIKK